MPVPDQSPVNSSTGNGVTTVFPYTFKILDEEDLLVQIDDVVTTDYSVSGVGVDGGGNITFSTAPEDGSLVVRSRNLAYDRTENDYQEGGGFEAATVDEDFDRLVMMAQQLAAGKNRGIKAPISETDDQVFLDADWDARASKLLAFDADGRPTVVEAGDTGASLPIAGGTMTGILYLGNPALFGEDAPQLSQFSASIGVAADLIAIARIIAKSKGDNGLVNGQATLELVAMDSDDVANGTRGILYPLNIRVAPRITRVGSVADANGVSIQNVTGVANACATDAIWVGHNTSSFAAGNPEWQALLNSNARSVTGIRFSGEITGSTEYFIDFFDATLAGGAIRIPNNKAIKARDAGNLSDRTLITLNASDQVVIGTGAASIAVAEGVIFGKGVATQIPVTPNAATYTQLVTDTSFINNYVTGTTTITLLAASSYSGRILFVKNTEAQALVSASSNVVPLAGGAAGTAILAATDGKWAMLQSDGTNWVIMASN